MQAVSQSSQWQKVKLVASIPLRARGANVRESENIVDSLDVSWPGCGNLREC
jgi:hypothetical protein